MVSTNPQGVVLDGQKHVAKLFDIKYVDRLTLFQLTLERGA